MNTKIMIACLAGAGIFVAASSLAIPDGRLSSRSTDFVQKAAIGGEYEIEASKIALKRSQNANIKQFAQEMIDDHSKANDQLKSTLRDDNVSTSIAPTALDSDHQQLIDKLRNDSQSDFDQDYINQQTTAHRETIKLFSSYVKKGDDAALKDFATQTLPTLRTHMQHVKQLKANA